MTDHHERLQAMADHGHLSPADIVAIRVAVNEIAQLRQRAEKAEAIVARLPKTADGVPITPGDTVWSLVATADRSGQCVYPVEMTTIQPGRYPRLYSTKEAAEAAKENNDAN